MSSHASVIPKKSGSLPQDLDLIERRIVRQLDYKRVMPYVFVIILLHHLDVAALGQSSVLGIIQDTNITIRQYGFIAAISHLGELVSQIPNAYFIQRVSVAKYLAVLVTVWGIILALSASATNFSQLVALRFGLGFFGSGLYPCCNLIVGRMYRKREQAQRLGVMVYSNGIAVCIGGIIAYGMSHMNGVGGLHSWQWLMLIYGSITILCGICCFFFMTDDPKSSTLTPDEMSVIDMRVADNGVTESRKINYSHIKESLKEPRYYCYILAGVLVHLQTGSVRAFGQLLMSSFGFPQPVSILLLMPIGLYVILLCILNICFVDRFGNRHYVACISYGASVLGNLLMIIIPMKKAKLIGLYLTTSHGAGQILIIFSITNNVMGSTKRIFYILSCNTAAVIGTFIGPLMITDPQQPLVALIVYTVSGVVAIVLVLIARYTMSKSNKCGRSFIQKDHGEDPTDRDIIDFKYKL